MAEPRIVLYDVETSHNIIAKFDVWKSYTTHHDILQERFMICAAWKDLGAKKVNAVSVLDDAKLYKADPYNDRHVITTLHAALSEADAVVAHNGDSFDMRWLQGRMLFHGLPPLPPVKQIDTLKIARSVFSLNSYRLDYLGKYLGLGGKTNTPPGLWIDVLRGDKKAIRTMVEYNKDDVTLLEGVFNRIRPHGSIGMNYQLFAQDSCCPYCGGTKFERRGYRHADTQVYARFRCLNRKCMKYFKSRKAEKGMGATHKGI